MFKIVALISLFLAAAQASYPVFTSDPSEQKALWEAYKAQFRKSYTTFEEETHRFHIFVENLKMIDLRNEAEIRHGGNAVHGTTVFSDLSQAEFESRYLTSDPSMKTGGALEANIVGAPDDSLGLVDWTGKYTTAVKDQGYCGSCWAFSATEQIESDAIRTLGVATILSPEQITQCDTTSYGCSGGWTENAYNYVKKAGGLETNADYPYTSGTAGVTGTCKSSSSKFVIGVNSYTTVKSETSMATYVQGTGPLSVCLDASTWNSYTGGVVTVCGKSVDHCVQAVGVDTASGYWKVRNSWGTSWGEAGFIRLKYGANTCNIANDATYVSVKKV